MPTMHSWVCVGYAGAWHSRGVRPVFMRVLPSCPEACYPDVRPPALRARQYLPSSFPFSLASHCDMWDLSWSPCASLWWKKSGVCVRVCVFACVCQRVCVRRAASALSSSLHCWYTFGWKYKCTETCRWRQCLCGNIFYKSAADL